MSGTEIISSDAGTSYTGNYGLDASWTLYNGGENQKNIRLQELYSKISVLDTEETIKGIEENIIQLYIQILYSSEAVEICRNTLDVSIAQSARGQELFDAGTLSRADLAQLKAQEGSDRYSLVSAEATLQDYMLQLKQLLELEGGTTMELAMPEISDEEVLSIVPDKAAVYSTAVESRPEIRSGKLDVDASGLNIGIARAGYLPSLTLSAGIGTSHTSGTDYTFTEQIKNGWNLMSMKSMEASLPGDRFVRAHKSFIINKEKIEAIDRGRIVIGNSSIPVGDNYKEGFQKSIGIEA